MKFWDLSQPPLFDVCTSDGLRGPGVGDGNFSRTLTSRFTAPGLLSGHNLQSAAFWSVEYEWRQRTLFSQIMQPPLPF